MPHTYFAAAKAAGAKLRLRRTHIFRGERRKGDLKGYHHEGRRPKHTITPGTRIPLGKGVYEARWVGFGKTGLGKPSTFFPSTWTQAEVEEAIRLAAGIAIVKKTLEVFRAGSRWKFEEVARGIRIVGLLSWSRRTIITSHPSRMQ